MLQKTFIAFLISFQVLGFPVLGQDLDIEFTEVKGVNGKPIGKIRNITQDPSGYMWFSGEGERCLYRYDGNQMVAFKNDHSNPNSLGGTVINAVYADPSGLIWIGMEEGLDQYNPATRVFRHFRHQANDSGSISKGNVSVMLRDQKGRLWVGTDNGLDQLNEQTGSFIHFKSDPSNPASLTDDVIWNLYEDRGGTLWVATGHPFYKPDPAKGGLSRLNPDGTFTRYVHDSRNASTLIDNRVRALFEDSRGVFWVGTSGDGLHTMDRKSGQLERHPYNPARPEQLSRPPLIKTDPFAFDNDQVTFVLEDGRGYIWIGTMWSGMNRYDPSTQKVTRYFGSHGFPDSSAWNGFVSRDGTIWISTQSDRLYHAGPIRPACTKIKTTAPVFSFLENDKGQLWAGTDKGGLLALGSSLQVVSTFRQDPVSGIDLSKSKINALYQGQPDTIWIGASNGLFTFNTRTKRITAIPTGFNVSDALGGIFALQKDRFGNLWFTSGNGLGCYRLRDGTIKHYQPDSRDSGSIGAPRTISLAEDRNGNLWVGASTAGVTKLDRQTDKFRRYLAGHNGICLTQDHMGVLWAGTSKGLFRYDKEIDQFLPFFDSRSDLASQYIYGITEDHEGNLWAYTPALVFEINANRSRVSTFGNTYDIHDLSPQAILTTRQGKVLFGSVDGFYLVDGINPGSKAEYGKIAITDLFINNENTAWGEDQRVTTLGSDLTALHLRYNQNTLGFNFSAMEYGQSNHVRYYTMLEGYDNTWREAIGEKSSYYFNVAPGTYTYRIKAFNSEGEWFDKEVVVKISPPWWSTWWFQSLVVVCICLGVYYYIQYRSRELKKNNLILEKKVLERTNALNTSLAELKLAQDQLIQSEKMASLGELTSGIAHEIKNPLNFINNFSEINTELITDIEDQINALGEAAPAQLQQYMKTLQKNSEKIMHHGKRIDGIVKGMLQHSRQANRNKERTNINLLCEEALKLAYHGFKAKEKSFNSGFEARLEANLPEVMVIPQDISRVLLNLINNAFYAVNEKKKQLFSEDQEEESEGHYNPIVTVATRLSASRIIITVADNGSGIPASILNKIYQPFFTTKPTGEGTGLGLSMSYDIITKGHGGELKVTSREGEGTSFEISLPLNN